MSAADCLVVVCRTLRCRCLTQAAPRIPTSPPDSLAEDFRTSMPFSGAGWQNGVPRAPASKSHFIYLSCFAQCFFSVKQHSDRKRRHCSARKSRRFKLELCSCGVRDAHVGGFRVLLADLWCRGGGWRLVCDLAARSRREHATKENVRRRKFVASAELAQSNKFNSITL